MNNDQRIVYVKRSEKYERINFDKLAINESFILCESDGTPVGHYCAASVPYRQHGIYTIETIEIAS